VAAAKPKGEPMTDAALRADRFVERDFRVGHALSRAAAVFSRNFPKYIVVTAIAGLPSMLIGLYMSTSPATPANPFQNLGWTIFGAFLAIVLSSLSQAIVLYGAFQDMRGRPVSLADCFAVGLGRILPIIVLSISVAILGMLGSMLLIFPGLMLFTMWFVATPACVVERLGPFRSMGRSRELTKGYRWKIFGIMLVILIPALIVGGIVLGVMTALGVGGAQGFIGTVRALNGAVLTQVVSLIWNAIWTAFYAIVVVVTYHDLRVAKEGVDTDQIAAVFD
jgi:hypothetical protein